MLVIPKRNYPITFSRSTFVNREVNFTQFAVSMRCVRKDLYAQTITLHYLSDGNIYCRLLFRKQEFLIPIIVLLKALADTSDQEIYNSIVKGDSTNSEISDRIEVILRHGKSLNITNSSQALRFLGSRFRVVLNLSFFEVNDEEIGKIFINENICVHLAKFTDKYNCILLMIDKLLDYVTKKHEADNQDSLANQEVLVTGHLYQMVLRERIDELLQILRFRIIKDCLSA